MSVARIERLALIGLAAGVFSALFGVGGGTVIVPSLMWLGYNVRTATGTSLAAICVIALFAAIDHGIYGNVQLGKSVLVGIPAVAGVYFGTWLQQRVSTRTISLLFALLLTVVGLRLVLG